MIDQDASTAAAPAESFAALFEESQKNTPQYVEGDVVNGRVVKVEDDHVLVDIGFKSEGMIALDEFRGPDGETAVAVGDQVDVVLERYENETGDVVLSKEKADKAKIWEEVAKACEQGEVIEGRIVSKVKGGMAVDIGIKAFLPGSQIDLSPVRNMDSLIGQNFQFKIIKFNKKRGNIVLSRRVLLEKEREAMREKTLALLEEGNVMEGTVKNITDYGAFIDLGGIDGLLHITDMSWKRINHPSELLSMGQKLDVKVLKYDRERERVSLGLKQITDDPWSGAEDKYPINNKVSGKVVSLTDYGAFVELEDGIEGLVHVSEMSWTRRIKHPSQVVNVGDEVEAIILDLDTESRKIALGLKQVDPNPWEVLQEKYPQGAILEGTVKNVTDFGVFIGVEDGIDGLIHVSDISWSQKIKDPSEHYQKGDSIKAVVLNIDAEAERFSLGIKQLTPDPWEEVARKYSPGTIVKGEVIKVTDFGIFVKLDEDLEGLIHISEIAEERVEDPTKYAEVGSMVDAVIQNCDTAERKISLSMRQLERSRQNEEFSKYSGKHASPKTTLGDLAGLKASSASESSEEAPAEETNASNSEESADDSNTEEN